jgi:hypothetical protein
MLQAQIQIGSGILISKSCATPGSVLKRVPKPQPVSIIPRFGTHHW